MTADEFQRLYAGPIRSHLRRSGAEFAYIEDTCQVMFLKLRARAERDGSTHPEGLRLRIATVVLWAYRTYSGIVKKQQREDRFRAECLSRARSKRRHGKPMPFVESSQTADPALAIEEAEMHSLVYSAVDGLPPPLREVTRLRMEELSLEEIATKLAITVGAVKSRQHRAKELLGAMLGHHFRD